MSSTKCSRVSQLTGQCLVLC